MDGCGGWLVGQLVSPLWILVNISLKPLIKGQLIGCGPPKCTTMVFIVFNLGILGDNLPINTHVIFRAHIANETSYSQMMFFRCPITETKRIGRIQVPWFTILSFGEPGSLGLDHMALLCCYIYEARRWWEFFHPHPWKSKTISKWHFPGFLLILKPLLKQWVFQKNHSKNRLWTSRALDLENCDCGWWKKWSKTQIFATKWWWVPLVMNPMGSIWGSNKL